MTKKHTYDWLPDLPDYRDHLYAIAAPRELPPSVDLRPKCPSVFDQGQLGSCTANALSGAVAFVHPQIIGSRLFIYYNERVMEGTVREDAGAMIRDGVKSLAKQGVCPETEWPYVITQFKRKPTLKCFKDAKPHAIASYQRLISLDQMQQCLADGFPFTFGFSVYEGFESAEMARTGVANMPAPGEKLLGGHAVLAVGYDQASRRFLVRNSWGAKWGMGGYFTLPFDYLNDRGLSDDFWTIRV